MSGKGFLGNMTENLQADCVQSRQAGFIQCFLKVIPHKDCAGLPKKAVPFRVRLLLLWNEGCGGGILWNLLLLFQVPQKNPSVSLRLSAQHKARPSGAFSREPRYK